MNNVVVPDRGRCGCGRAGGCGSRGPGGRCRACSRVAATRVRVRWASGCARLCGVSRRVFVCRARPLSVWCGRRLTRVSSMPPTAPMGMAPRSRVAARELARGAPRRGSTLGRRSWRPCAAAYTNTKLHGSFADRPRPISREFSFTHFVTDALPPASARNRKSLYPLRNDQRPRSAYRTKWCGVLAVS